MKKRVLLEAMVLMLLLTGCGSDKVEVKEPKVELLSEQTTKESLAEDVNGGEKAQPEGEQASATQSDEVQLEEEQTSATQQDEVPLAETQETGTVEEDGRVKVSILGDSISTFDEWIPEGYHDFFPMNGEVTDVNQTWWKMVLDEKEMKLCVNGSSSGSTCSGDSKSIDNPQYGCSDYRIMGLTGMDGVLPDVIIVYMGTNDLVTSVPLGDNDGTRAVEEGTIANFSDAYTLILNKLATNYPDAEIFCCTLTPVGDWGTDQPFVTFVNGQELSAVEYSEAIQKIAGTKGYPVIDLLNCGITIENMQQFITDGVHLKPEGMVLVKDAVLKVMNEYY